MKQKLVIFTLAIAGGMLGANVQPILTGAGKLLFPEASPAAYVQASSGALTIAAGGTNKGIYVLPSGTGYFGVSTMNPGFGIGFTGTLAGVQNTGANSQVLVGQSSTAHGHMAWQYNASESSATLDIGSRTANALRLKTGNSVRIFIDPITGNMGAGGNLSPNYAVDATGDANVSGVYRVGGTQVVGARKAAVTAPSGGGTSLTDAMDPAARTAINDIISRLQSHGLIN